MSYQTMDGRYRGIYAVENLGGQSPAGEAVYIRKQLDGTKLFYRKQADGIMLLGREKIAVRETALTEENHTVFRHPLRVGTEWKETTFTRVLIKTGPPQKTEFHIVARVPVIMRVDSMTDTVDVPAGTFGDCMRITVSGDAFTNAGNYVGRTIVRVHEVNWYAPGVGLVKSVRRESTTSQALDKGEITLELEAY